MDPHPGAQPVALVEGLNGIILSDEEGNPDPDTRVKDLDWSSDGKRIAFISRNGYLGFNSVWVVNADGTGLKRLITQPTHERGRRLYPDGTWEMVLLTPFFHAIAWAPGDSLILFMDNDGLRYTDLEVHPAGSSEKYHSVRARSPILALERLDWFDAISDGRLLIASYECPSWGEANIWSINVDGSDKRSVVHCEPVWHPQISPDGQKMSYYVWDRIEESVSLWVRDLDSQKDRFLAEGSVHAWSPDSKRIAFVEATGWRTGKIKVIDADGTNSFVLQDHWAGDISWSSRSFDATPTSITQETSWGAIKASVSRIYGPK